MNYLKQQIYNHVIPFLGKIFVGKNKYCNVIYYHDIVRDEGHSFMRTNVDVFKQQMLYIKDNGYETIRFDDFDNQNNLLFRQKRVLIVFDDGWQSNFSEIYDWMLAQGLKYNVFLAVGLINNDSRYLTWDMIRTMHRSGLCGFGTHTYSHVDASQLTEQCYLEEIKKADSVFSQELGYVPKDFCYPYGKYSTESLQKLIKDSGYERIYLSSMIYSYQQSGKYVMGRNGISNEDAFLVFKNKVKGYYNIFSIIVN